MEKIIINQIEQLIGKDSGNPYWKIKTNKGDMSCFDKEIADKLWKAQEEKIEVGVDANPSKDGKYVNIRKVFGPKETADIEEADRNYDNFKKPEVEKPVRL